MPGVARGGAPVAAMPFPARLPEECAMRRAIGPVAIVLALVTGIVLAETRRVAFMSAVVRDSDPPAGINTGVIRRFYAAVNELLATGDDAAFTAAVDAELIEHPARAGVSPNRDGFVRALIALRAIAPNLQLVALDVVAQGDRVVARVAVEGGEGAKFLGRPLAADRLWGAVDLFRIEADRVVEHWSASTETALLEPLATLTVPTADPTHRVVTLERWTYAPDTSERRSTDWSSLLIFVDEGTLTITIDGLESSAARPVQGGRIGTAPNWGAPPFGTPQTLRPGDALLAPDATTFTASNSGGRLRRGTDHPCATVATDRTHFRRNQRRFPSGAGRWDDRGAPGGRRHDRDRARHAHGR
jgi:predicted ester cyclase